MEKQQIIPKGIVCICHLAGANRNTAPQFRAVVQPFRGNYRCCIEPGIYFMSLMFPTIYGLGIAGLGDDTKIGGAGMIMAIAGAAVLTQIQGIVSDQSGSINLAFWVPAIAFMIIAFYAAVVSKKYTS